MLSAKEESMIEVNCANLELIGRADMVITRRFLDTDSQQNHCRQRSQGGWSETDSAE